MYAKFYNGHINRMIMNCIPKLLDNRNNPLSIQNNLMKIESRDVKTRQAGFHDSIMARRN